MLNPVWCGPWRERGPYLLQHLVIWNFVHLGGVDLSFKGVLVEFTADVYQQRGGAGIDGAAQHDVVDIPGDVDAVAQDHANEKPWERGEKQMSIYEHLNVFVLKQGWI